MNKLQQIATFVKGMKNPQQTVMQLLSNNTNPMAQSVLKMAQNGDTKGIEDFARNVCKERGVDFDKEFTEFVNNFK